MDAVRQNQHFIATLMKMEVDFIIVGQGLSGTWLSYYLKQGGAKILVLDPGVEHTASSIASGLINPISGMRLARQAMGEVLEPFAKNAYQELGQQLNTSLVRSCAIHHYFSTAAEANFFEEKADDVQAEFLSTTKKTKESIHFNFQFGIGKIAPVMLVNVPELLQSWRKQLRKNEELLEQRMEWDACSFYPKKVSWGNLSARAIIDCTGAAAVTHPFFSRLPFSLNKGEAILAEIPDLPSDDVLKFGKTSIVPWRDGLFWLGTTFDLHYENALPSVKFRNSLEQSLKHWLRLPFKFVEPLAALRPATITRAPFCGYHPSHPSLYILNGLGSKGCAQAPYLAQHLAKHLLHGKTLLPFASLDRYTRILSQNIN